MEPITLHLLTLAAAAVASAAARPSVMQRTKKGHQ